MLRPGGAVYLTFCSKESTEYQDSWFPKLGENTLISQDEAEKGIPHYYVDLNDLRMLLTDFEIELIKHTEYCSLDRTSNRRERFFYVSARSK